MHVNIQQATVYTILYDMARLRIGYAYEMLGLSCGTLTNTGSYGALLVEFHIQIFEG